jgi:hypothetical protein
MANSLDKAYRLRLWKRQAAIIVRIRRLTQIVKKFHTDTPQLGMESPKE